MHRPSGRQCQQRPPRPHPPLPHQRSLGHGNARLTAGVATDDTSWWPRIFRATTWPTVKPTTRREPPSNSRQGQHMPIHFHALRSSMKAAHGAKHCRFDTDSFKIGVDNHASRCMSNNRAHFEDLRLSRSNATVGGIAGGLAIKGIGTFRFRVEDDDGKVHTICIPNSLYLPSLPVSLLSPQHWAQEARDDIPISHGTRMENYADGCKLIWHQMDFSKTVPFDAATNTPVFWTAPSTHSYCAFISSAVDINRAYYQTEIVENHYAPRAIPRRITPPSPDEFIADENINMSENGGGTSNTPTPTPTPTTVPTDSLTISSPVEAAAEQPVAEQPVPLQARCAGALTFNPTPEWEPEEVFDLAAANPQAELMRWHYRLGHLPFAKLKQLAQLGEIRSDWPRWLHPSAQDASLQP